ncbi:BatD family protein [Allorhodopirellula solitaria]|uniref:DUF7939 domain-containing protein n=1 Tax=Allorhodopirellula solitaria TaxID=2527987 RepID=A0A5C5YE78_9BACT|nr:BatD family protein [Allorhodopirellula solitaria]TWT73123.1 hypothetical protein CA85_15900 [Allorhodopirellula solitaria]
MNRLSLGILLLVMAWTSTCLAQQKTVEASLKKKTAWTGEAVPMQVKLFSPGPFDGTPAFDLPQLPLTTIIKTPGSPVVQNEEVDGESWFTQLYEFVIYTQREGEIVIPTFQVRFEGKRTFTGDPEPMSGKTKELDFQSKRPPGTRQMGVVVAASGMENSQAWDPDTTDPIKAGDVIERKITRQADDTTAMMFSPIDTAAPAGVQLYSRDPVVQDDNERGAFHAQRIDTIKYQFPRGGAFDLPDIALVWWDTKSNSLQKQTLEGKSITVLPAAQHAAEPPASPLRRAMSVIIPIALIALGVWVLRRPISKAVARWQAERNSPVNRAAKQLHSACRSNDTEAAYVALIDWQHAMGASDPSWRSRLSAALVSELDQQSAALAKLLYAGAARETHWQGNQLAGTFAQIRRELAHPRVKRRAEDALPDLNPT